MRYLLAAVLVISVLVFQGCETMQIAADIGTDIALKRGAITDKQAESIRRGAQAAGKAFEEFTPENEYYIGRTIAANILAKYKAYQNNDAIRYVNVLGQTLAEASDKPETFKGYRLMILDTEEINAFATPGGFILITRGLIRCAKTEDALAAVLAHEIGHVQLGHGMAAIQAGRYTSLGQIVGVELAKNLGDEQLAQVAEVFDGAVGDIMKTLVDTGYQSSQEYDADRAAVEIMKRVGYNPQALKDLLAQMGKRLGAQAGGFGKTHPSPQDRLRNIAPLIEGFGGVTTVSARQARFVKATAGL